MSIEHGILWANVAIIINIDFHNLFQKQRTFVCMSSVVGNVGDSYAQHIHIYKH